MKKILRKRKGRLNEESGKTKEVDVMDEAKARAEAVVGVNSPEETDTDRRLISQMKLIRRLKQRQQQRKFLKKILQRKKTQIKSLAKQMKLV